MRTKFISTLIAATLLLQTAPAFAAFSDVTQSHPNYLSIKFLNEQGVVKGYEDNTFRPAQKVNRAEALKIILVGLGVEVPATAASTSFSDVKTSDWFASYVMKAKELAIVNGNPDGTFAPGRTVARAEFVKMLLMSNGFKIENWKDQEIFNDVKTTDWFAPYMNYAGSAGLLTKDANNNLNPGLELGRGEVAEIFYLMTIIRQGGDTQFLLNQAELQMSQIEFYIGGNEPLLAKRAAELSVDMTQQAMKNMPDNNVVIAAAKLARAYDFLMNAFITGIQKDYVAARSWADQAITKATEAWEANNEIQGIAKHIKDRANEIIKQIPTT
jgi:hypothetical protein